MLIENNNLINQIPDYFMKVIKERIEEATKEELERALEKAKEVIKAKETEIIAGVILQITKIMEIERLGELITIRVKLDQNENKNT